MSDDAPDKPAVALENVLAAYAHGLFPMAEDANEDAFYWYDPEMRGQLSIDALHVPRRLKKTILQHPFEIRFDSAFEEVIRACGQATPERPQTWINEPIIAIFTALHGHGFAHSAECWAGDELVGGVYGLALGGLFAGESMFSRRTNASKIALVHLCARLWKGGFTVFDTQFVNPHLLQFGCYEIPRAEYQQKLRKALSQNADFSLAAWPELSVDNLIQAYFAHLETSGRPPMS